MTGYQTRQGVIWARVLILQEDRYPSLIGTLPIPRPLKALSRTSDR